MAFSAIPSDTYTPFASVKKRTKKIGYNRGLPDMFIIYRTQDGRQRAAFVEMKRERLGKVSDEQKKWIEAINDTP